MPWSNVPEEKWPEMESCVKKVLADHEGEKDFDKSNATAICYKSIVGYTIEIVQDPTAINAVLGASYLPGELLRWEDMELARAETNANGDELFSEDITALADTLPLMPIDDVHDPQRLVGLFTAARNADDRLKTDGIIYARRFPEVAQDILDGRKRPSIEAYAERAVCSVCNEEFLLASAYCAHLRDRKTSGAKRRFKGIKAVGGGLVYNPAGSTASFDLNKVYMVASHQEDELDVAQEERNLLLWYAVMDIAADETPDVLAAAKKKWSKDVKLDEGSLTELGWPSYEKVASAVESGKVSYQKAIQKLAYLANVSKDSATASKARSFVEKLKARFRKEGDENKNEGGNMNELERVQAELAAALEKLTKLEEEHGKLQAANASLQADFDKVKADQEAVQARNSALVKANRRMVLAGVLTDEEFKEQEPTIMGMSDEAVNLFAAKAKPGQPLPQPAVNLDPPAGGPVKITL